MKKILVLTDFSHKSEHAAEIALKIAEQTESKVIFYNSFLVPELVPPITSGVSGFQSFQEIQLDNLRNLESFAEKVSSKVFNGRKEGRPPVSCMSEEGFLAESLNTVLKAKSPVWLIIMGDKSADRGFFEQLVNGSETELIINESNRPVMLIPEKARFRKLQSIALATNLERSDYKALKMLLELGRFFNSKITLIHVCPDRLTLEQKLKNIEFLRKIKARLKYPDILYEDVTGAGLSSALAKFASAEKVDLLSIIHKRHSLFEKLFHKSTTDEMLQYHRLPLMVFPPGFK